jgi:HK97 family phage major capsid protein
MPSLVDVREELATKRQRLHEVFEEAGPELDLSKVKSLDGDTATKAGEIRRMNEELDALGVEFDRLSLLEQIGRNNESQHKRFTEPAGAMTHPANGTGGGSPNGRHADARAQLKALIREHQGVRNFRDGKAGTATIELPYADFKTLITLTTISPQTRRLPTVDMALEERTIADLMLDSQIDRGTVEYYEETTVTNSAATVAEAGTKPESALAWTLRTETARKIGHWIPATKEALDDNAGLEGQIRGRLSYGVRRVEETQLLTGDGNAPNLRGLLNRANIQTYALAGADSAEDALYKGMQLVRGSAGYGFAEPTAIVMHPNDFTAIKLHRTTDGIYIYGNPSDESPDRIWGLPVRQTTAMTENTALVGAFRPHAEVLRREGITITMSTEHSTYFLENKVAILAEERLALAVYRPSAFCTVTGI